MDDVMKIVKYIEESGLLMKIVSETIENETKEHKCGFLGMLSAILGVHLLRNMLAGKEVIPTSKGTIRVDWDSITSHPLPNFEIENYCQNERKFEGIYSRSSLPKKKVGSYVMILDGYKLIGTHLIALYANVDNVTYFDNAGVEYIQKKVKKLYVTKTSQQIFIEYKQMIQQYAGLVFINFMLKGISFLDYTNLFSPKE